MGQFSNAYPEDHYESASICYGSPANNVSNGGHRGSNGGGLKPRNYPRGSGNSIDFNLTNSSLLMRTSTLQDLIWTGIMNSVMKTKVSLAFVLL